MSKSDLAARPLLARTRDVIEAHLTIVLTALAVSRTVQNRTRLSLRRVLRTLKPLRSAGIEINGVISTFPPALGPDDTTILNALACRRRPKTRPRRYGLVFERRRHGRSPHKALSHLTQLGCIPRTIPPGATTSAVPMGR